MADLYDEDPYTNDLEDMMAYSTHEARYWAERPQQIKVCRDALDAWERLIEHLANGGTTLVFDDGQEALGVLTAELLENAPTLPLLAAMESVQCSPLVIRGPYDGA